MMQASIIVSGFLTMILINRNLGLENYGIYMIIISIVSILSNVITARGLEVVPKFYVREYEKCNYKLAKLTLVLGLILDLISSIFLLLLIYFTADFFSNKFIADLEYSYLIIIYSLVAIMDYLKNTPTGYFIAIKNFKVYNNLIILENFMKIISVLVCLYFFTFSLENIIYGFLVVAVIVATLNYYFFIKLIDKNILINQIQKNTLFIKEYLYFNLNTFSSSLLKAGNQNIDNLILSYFVNPASVGLYQTIKKFFVPMQFIASPFATLNYSKYIKMYENKEYGHLKASIKNITKNVVGVSLAYGIVLIGLMPFILEFMMINNTKEIVFMESIIFISLLFLNTLWWTRTVSLTINPYYSLYWNIISLIYILCISSFLTYHFDLIGLIISICILNIMAVLYWLNKLLKELNVN